MLTYKELDNLVNQIFLEIGNGKAEKEGSFYRQ